MEARLTARAAGGSGSLASWNSLSSVLEVPLDVIDAAPAVQPPLEDAVGAPSDEPPTLGSLWAEVGAATLRTGKPELRWLTRSTLVCTGSGETSPSSLENLAAEEARSRGASMRLPIYPAHTSSRHWTAYKSWFPFASAIDEGRLHAIAYVNAAAAARTAVERLAPATNYAYDDAAGTLELGSNGRRAVVDAETFVSIGVMRGLLPEQTLIAAAEAAEARLHRLERLADGVWAGLTSDGVRFDRGIPALLVDGIVVLDPLAGAYVATGREDPEHERALALATSSGLTTPCTCREPREVRKVLRPRAEVYSFGSASESGDWLFVPAGDTHCAVYELQCPHATCRPTRDAWTSEGWTLERCDAEWWRRPARGDVLIAGAAGWASTAVLAYAEEIAAFATSAPLLGGVAREGGLPPGRTVTVYAPHSNLLFLTDEDFEDEPRLRSTLDSGVLRKRLEAEALPLGAAVGYLASTRIEASPPLPLRVRRLEAAPERFGFMEP
jgi:hypothetical protein